MTEISEAGLDYALGGSTGSSYYDETTLNEGYGGDFVDELQKGAWVLGHAGLGFVEMGGISTDQTRAYFADKHQYIAEQIGQNYDTLSPEGKARVAKTWLTADTDQAVWADAGAAGLQIASMLPSLAVTLVPAGIMARVALAIGGTGAAITAGAATGAVTEGALGAGTVWHALVEGIAGASPEEMMESSRYKYLVEVENYAHEQAQNRIIAELNKAPAIGAGVASMALGAFSGGVLGKGLTAALRTRIGAQTLAESGTEGLQEVTEGVAERETLMGDVGLPSMAPTPGAIAEAGVQGAFGGAVLGGGVAAIGGIGVRPSEQLEQMIRDQMEEDARNGDAIAGVDADVVAATGSAIPTGAQSALDQADAALTQPQAPAAAEPPVGAEPQQEPQAQPTGAIPTPGDVQGPPEIQGPQPAPPQQQAAAPPQAASPPGGVGPTRAQELNREGQIPPTAEELGFLRDTSAPQAAESLMALASDPQGADATQTLVSTLQMAAQDTTGGRGEELANTRAAMQEEAAQAKEAVHKRRFKELEEKGKSRRGRVGQSYQAELDEIDANLNQAMQEMDEAESGLAHKNVRYGQAADALQRLAAGDQTLNKQVALERLALGLAALEPGASQALMQGLVRGDLEGVISVAEDIARPMAGMARARSTGIERGRKVAAEEAVVAGKDPEKAVERFNVEDTEPTAALANAELGEMEGRQSDKAVALRSMEARAADEMAANAVDRSTPGTDEGEGRAPTKDQGRLESRFKTKAAREKAEKAGKPIHPQTLGEKQPGEKVKVTKTAEKKILAGVRRREKEAAKLEKTAARLDKKYKGVAAAQDKAAAEINKKVALGDVDRIVSAVNTEIGKTEEQLDKAREDGAPKELIKRLEDTLVDLTRQLEDARAMRGRVEAQDLTKFKEQRPVRAEPGMGGKERARLKADEVETSRGETFEERDEARKEAVAADRARKKETSDAKSAGTRKVTALKKKRTPERTAEAKTRREIEGWLYYQMKGKGADGQRGKTLEPRKKAHKIFDAMMTSEPDKARELGMAAGLSPEAIDMLLAVEQEAQAEVDQNTAEWQEAVEEAVEEQAEEAAAVNPTPKVEIAVNEAGIAGAKADKAKRVGKKDGKESEKTGTPVAEPKAREDDAKRPEATSTPVKGEAGRRNKDGTKPAGPAGRPAAGPEPTDTGAAGGVSPVGRTDKIIFDGERLPEPDVYVDEQSYNGGKPLGGLNEDQRLGVNMALTRLQKELGFLLADGMGLGKTRQIIAIADKMAQLTGKPSLIVTQGMGPIKGSFTYDADKMGFDYAESNVELTNYDQVKAGKAGQGDYGVVIFDEAHNLKNSTTDKTIAAKAIIADTRVFSTGTPMDNPAAAAYFMAEISGQTEEEVADAVGIKYEVDPRDENKIIIKPKKGMVWKKVIANLIRLRNDAVDAGAFLRRALPFRGTIGDYDLPMSTQELKEQQDIDNHYEFLLSEEGLSWAQRRGLKGQRGRELHRLAEEAKIPHVVAKALEDIAAGRQVIIVADKVTPTKEGNFLREYKGAAEEVTKLLEAAGHEVGKIYGSSKTKVDPRIVAGNRFQAGEIRVVVMTAKSGGTGINLDDVTGNAPRTMLIMSKDFSGDVFDQVLGRVSRLNTASDARVEFINFPDSLNDQRRTEIIDRKLEILRAIQEGKDPDEAALENSKEVGATGGLTAEFKTTRYRDRDGNGSDRMADAIIMEALANGGTNLDSMLDTIITHSTLADRQDLAKRLKGMFAGLGMPVTAANEGVSRATIEQDPVTLGVTRTTEIDPNAHDLTHKVLHEGVHHASLELLANNPVIRRQIERLLRQVQAVAAKRGVDLYGLTNAAEFVAEAFTSPDFQEFLKLIPHSDTSTMFGRFKHFIKKLMIRLGVGENLHTVMDQMIELDPLADPRESSPDARLERRLEAMHESTEAQYGPEISEGMRPLTGAGRGLLTGFKDAWTNATIGEHARAFVLNTSTGRQIQDIYRKHFEGGALDRYFRATRRKDVAARKHQKRTSVLFTKWQKLVTASKENRKLGRILNNLMLNSTLYQVDPRTGMGTRTTAAGNQVKAGSTAQQAKHAEMVKDWDALPDEFKEIFNEVEAFYRDELARVVSSLKKNILYRTLIDPSRSKKLAEDITTIEEFETFLEDEPGAFEEKGRDAALQSFRELFKMNEVPGPYFPLRRYGDKVVRASGKLKGDFTPDEIEAMLREQPGLKVTKQSKKISDEGKHTVTFTLHSVQFFENQSEAVLAQEDINEYLNGAGFTDVKTPPVVKRAQYTGEGNGVEFNALERRIEAMGGKEGEQEAALMMLRHATMALLPDTSVRKAQMRRLNVAGASQDMRRAMAEYALSGSHYLANLEHTTEIHDAMRDVEKSVRAVEQGETTGDPILMRDVYNQLLKREDKSATIRQRGMIERKLTNLGFVWYLGSASYSVVNATQPLVFTLPWLAARSNPRTAARHLTKAYWAITPSIFNKSPGTNTLRALKNMATGGELPADIMEYLEIDPKTEQITVSADMLKNIEKNYGAERAAELGEMLSYVAEQGLLDVSLAMDMSEGAAGTSLEMRDGKYKLSDLSNQVAGGAIDAARILPHAVEVMNRTVTAIAAYELYMEQNTEGSLEARKKAGHAFAEDAVSETQFDYNTANNASILNANIPGIGLIMQFKKHLMHVYHMLVKNSIQAWPEILGGRASKADRRVARRMLLGLLGTHATLGGVIGATPEPIKWAIGMVGAALGGDDWEGYEIEMRQAMYDILGEDIGEMVSRGVPRLAGFDMSNRIGMDSMLAFGEPRGGSSDELAAWAAKMALGPVAGIAWNSVDAAQAFARGDFQRGAEKMTPKAVRDLIRTGGLAQQGIKDTHGGTIVDAKDIGPTDYFWQVLGFQPSVVAESYAQRNAVLGRQSTIKTKRQNIIDRYATASRSERLSLDRERREFNKQFGREDPASRIQYSTLRSAAKSKAKRAEAARRGEVYVRGRRSRLGESGRFANR